MSSVPASGHPQAARLSLSWSRKARRSCASRSAASAKCSILGDPAAYPKVYDASSPLTYVKEVKAPLLSLQGENDIRVPREQAQQVTDAIKADGGVAEVIFYPAEGHGFAKRENQVDALRRTVDWFDRHLKISPR